MKKSDLLEVKSQVKWDKINGLWDALVGWAYARTSSAKSRPTTDQTGKCGCDVQVPVHHLAVYDGAADGNHPASPRPGGLSSFPIAFVSMILITENHFENTTTFLNSFFLRRGALYSRLQIVARKDTVGRL